MRGEVSRGSVMALPLAGYLWCGAAVGAGALAVLSLPPNSMLAFIPLSYGALFLLVHGHGLARSFVGGWLFGVGYFTAGLSWIAESFLVDAERFGVYALPAVVGLSVLLAVFPGIAMAVFAALRSERFAPYPVRAVLFSACWAGAEWLRGHVLTGFPWNLAAYATTDFAALRQPAAWFGSYGLSFVVVLLGVLTAQTLVRHRRWPSLALIGAIVGSLWLGETISGTQATVAERQFNIRIVQGNFPQREKWAPGAREAAISRYLTLSAKDGPTDAVLWPETAFPGFLDEDENAKLRIFTGLPSGSVLLTGVPDRAQSSAGPRYYNTIQVYDPKGELVTRYAKHRLVPFGEYVPLRDWLPIERLTEGRGDFTPGPGAKTLVVPSLPPFSAAICYEIIFPGHVVDDAIRPDWIFNPSNDAWFGTSIGPEQHLAAARFRAVEEGLPVVRAVNTGISAVIDAKGDIVARLELEQTGTIDAELPPPLSPTLYSRFGDWTLLPLLIGAWLAGIGTHAWAIQFFSFTSGRPKSASGVSLGC